MMLDWKDVEIASRGKRVKGRYAVIADNFVTVVTWCGAQTARLGILPPERLAQMVLRNIVSQEQDK